MPAATEKNKEGLKLEGNLAFVKEVAKYFMDFLETDFHKRKNPKRSVKLRNRDGLLIGLNLAKYPSFEREVFALIGQAFQKDAPLRLSRNVYRTSLPQGLLDLVKLQVGKMKSGEINTAVDRIADEIEKIATLHSKEHDKALSAAYEYAAVTIKDSLVLPFVQEIEKPIENMGMGDENDIYLIEEELTEILSKLIESKISETLNRVIAKERVNISKELRSVFELDTIKASVLAYFDNLKVGDLFSEVFEIAKNKAILDKQDFYLYLGEITFDKNKYPIFYIPFTADQSGDSYSITFDSQLYINKRALEYIVQEYNVQKGTRGALKTTADRIIYLANHTNGLVERLNAIVSEICNLFDLDKRIDLGEPRAQVARSLLVKVSNTAQIALFDKSDEALVNDYEEILQALNSEGGELSGIFNRLIDDFIHKNPVSVNPEVENEWDDSETPDKLVYASPIPLNSEQLQILSGLRKKDCKYVIVEGPPGTGKSHTITAICFDAVLNHKSVLILSDKKEALDVVEDKITETMKAVRFGDEELQNPILRLGKIGNTYNKILSKSTIERIKSHQRVVKKSLPELEQSIEREIKALKSNIQIETESYENIEISQIHDFHDLESAYEKNPFPFDLAEIAAAPSAIQYLAALRAFLAGLPLRFADNPAARLLNIDLASFSSPDELKAAFGRVALVNAAVAGVSERMGDKVKVAVSFEVFSDYALPTLKKFLEQYRAEKFPVFGYMFSRSAVARIDSEFRAAFPFARFEKPHAELEAIGDAIELFDHLVNLKAQGHGIPVNGSDNLAEVIPLLANREALAKFSELAGQLAPELSKKQARIERYPKTMAALKISPRKLDSWLSNRLIAMTDDEFEKACDLVHLKDALEGNFNQLPKLDYAQSKKQIETLVTTKVTHLLDTRVVDFCTHYQNDATTLRSVIREKRKFPKEEFAKLKDAFPCIIAGIRDYAEYIPLEPGIFDLVIIDEASQVSIAQAFPALIRAKKVLILGDKKQFSNVKSGQARSETNTEYKNTLETTFRREISTEDSKLVKLRKFDIKTSILEFFESISNYNTQLLKHFRGYRELISYSNRYFYLDSLQVMKIRGKSIDEVIKFTEVEPKPSEPIQNTNSAEVDQIILELGLIAASGEEPSVGIITPHTNQQKLLMEEISKRPGSDYFFDKLHLKIMTFDTCQGEERDIILYSMVASEHSDKLWGVFIKSFENIDADEDGKIKVQRLNVGFSRAKECAHFFISKPLDKFEGSIGEALRHFKDTLDSAKNEKTTADVDARSPMEPQVLNWFYQTKFWSSKKDQVEFMPQFEIGKYLKQLDRTYEHPEYKVDFLIRYVDERHKAHNIIIEYDGFSEHFKDADGVNAFNYEHYYSEEDLYRQKVLESYGYQFIRINRFNAGKNPIATLDTRIGSILAERESSNSFLDGVHETIEGLENGEKKECPRCSEIRDIADFRDPMLLSGMGRICRSCKNKVAVENEPRPAASRPTPSNFTCPKCDAPMFERSGKYGKFYGCTRFPRCKATRTRSGQAGYN